MLLRNIVSEFHKFKSSGSVTVQWHTVYFFIFSCYESESEVTQLCRTFCNPMDCSLPGSCIQGTFRSRVLGVGCHFLLQGIFPTQGLNLGLPHYRQTLYCLSHQGSLAHLNEGTSSGVKSSFDFLFCPFYYCFGFSPKGSSTVILL